MSKIDLHLHSKYSADGEFSVKQLLLMCKKQKMEVISIADHNSVKAVDEAIRLGNEYGIKVLPGIEIDCVYEGLEFHLLGYGMNHQSAVFAELENNIYQQEVINANEKIQKFCSATGFELTKEEVFSKTDNGVVTGELIAEILLNREDATTHEILKPYLPGGTKSDMPYVNFYWDFFAQGKVAYTPVNYISFQEAIEIIHNNQGIAVLAHPGKNLAGNLNFVDEIIKLGIDGIEVFSSYHTKADVDYFYAKAVSQSLISTCGSDFHGKNKPNIQIGDCNPTIAEDRIIKQVLSRFG